MAESKREELQEIIGDGEGYVSIQLLLDNQCPRCGGPVPNMKFVGQYPGALSRTDNKTEICSNCGHLEAMEQMAPRSSAMGRERITPQTEWFVNR